jgi:hypothetical protein
VVVGVRVALMTQMVVGAAAGGVGAADFLQPEDAATRRIADRTAAV